MKGEKSWWLQPSILLVSISANSDGLMVGYFNQTKQASTTTSSGLPAFSHPLRNATVLEGQEVTLTCNVSMLHDYKLAWVHEDSQSILSIGRQLYTHSKRLSLAADHRTSAITISPALATDRGWYMCQINTDPMMASRCFLQVLVPPTIRDWSGPEVEAREGSTVQLLCLARAHPPAQVTWRRTDALPIFDDVDGRPMWVVEGMQLEFQLVRRDDSATYTCHIDNKVTPAISRDTQLIVTYPPMVWLKKELVGAKSGSDATLSCESDANPPPRHYWYKNGTKIPSTFTGKKYRMSERALDSTWEVLLTIRDVKDQDFNRYSCMALNPIGQAEGNLVLYEVKEQRLVALVSPSTTTKPTKNRQHWEEHSFIETTTMTSLMKEDQLNRNSKIENKDRSAFQRPNKTRSFMNTILFGSTGSQPSTKSNFQSLTILSLNLLILFLKSSSL